MRAVFTINHFHPSAFHHHAWPGVKCLIVNVLCTWLHLRQADSVTIPDLQALVKSPFRELMTHINSRSIPYLHVLFCMSHHISATRSPRFWTRQRSTSSKPDNSRSLRQATFLRLAKSEMEQTTVVFFCVGSARVWRSCTWCWEHLLGIVRLLRAK